jgi:hypothetical protein
MDEKWIAYKALVGHYERKRPIGRPGCRWDETIEVDLKEMVCEVGDWFNLPRVGTSGGLVTTRQWTYSSIKYRESLFLTKQLSAYQEGPTRMEVYCLRNSELQ